MNNKKSKVNKIMSRFVKKKNDSDITCKYVIFKDLKLIFMFELLIEKVVYIKINYLIIFCVDLKTSLSIRLNAKTPLFASKNL